MSFLVILILGMPCAGRAGGAGPDQDQTVPRNEDQRVPRNELGPERGYERAEPQARGGGQGLVYPADVVNHPYPFTPKFVWRGMFPGILERIEAEHHVIGVGGHAVKELAYYREAERHPKLIRHEVGRVIDTGVHYIGGGWTKLETTRGIVKVYNPQFDPLVSTVAPANRAAVKAVEHDLDAEFGREQPGYYNAQGKRVPEGDPSAVRLVGTARGR